MLVVFLPIFVKQAKIIFQYDFVAPLRTFSTFLWLEFFLNIWSVPIEFTNPKNISIRVFIFFKNSISAFETIQY